MAMRECVVLSLMLVALTLQNTVKAEDGPVLQTKSGVLKGSHMKAKGKDTVVHSYLGIPFAKPPVGSLRLAPPQPAEKWAGVRDATKQPLMCLQDKQILEDLVANVSMNIEVPDSAEDCLYLNVYTPSKPGANDKLPVMVWIHGGGLSMASASIFDGHVLAAYQDVVVVLIQYRLGLLGFFSTGDEHAPGNYGLLDQVAALQWVQENIHSFGGDPGLVTIFGESAGGVSVSLHVLSPLSANLFDHAIAESGTAAMDAIMSPNPLALAQAVGNLSGCDISSTKTIVDCVMQLTEEDILTIAKEHPVLLFGVTVDGHFLPNPAADLLQSHQFNKVPLITGITNDECGYMLPSFFSPPGWTDGMDIEQIVPSLTMFNHALQDQAILELVLNEYLGTSTDRIKIRDGFRELLGDFMFNIPARKVANFHRDAGAPVYVYEFQHPPSILQKKRPSFVGSDHGDEIVFVFGFCFADGHIKLEDKLSKEENELCRSVMDYWGNFARTGSPNGPGLTSWPAFGAEAEYLSIGLEQKPGKDLKGKHFNFMTQTLPQLINKRKEGPVAHTKLGSLRGSFMTAKGKETVVNSYLGVPFAKPPVGPLRLAPPLPAEPWQGVRDATKQPPMCIQDRQASVVEMEFLSMDVEIPEVSEDCLYLNIYTPVKPGEEDAKLPVMVWIHGGGLSLGSASVYDGSVLSAYQDVVVVLIQYRLGLLGFLSTGDEHAPGNYGLLDQVAALQWVQENIHSFGGDPGSVTIFGESAGGVSVSTLILSPLASGLFHRAIAESGTAFWHGLVMANPLLIAQNAAKSCNCDSSSSSKIVDCIMGWSDEEVLEYSKKFAMMHFSVAVDSHFLPEPVEEIIRKQEFSKVPLITGITDDEFGYLLPTYFFGPGWIDGMDQEQATKALTLTYPDPRDRWIIDLVANEYLGDTKDPIQIRDIYREMMGDVIFNIPTLQLAKYHSASGAPVYLYQFQHPPSMTQKKRPSFVGVDHADELFFIQGTCFAKAHLKATAPFTKEEEELCRTVMAYWGNFAHTGSPNGPGLTHWPEYEDEAEYLGIGLEQKPGKNLKGKHSAFMTKTLPDLIRQGREKREHLEL
ncbi:fatty acyl-CoA hydrolase precursor, medium chain [Rhinichthys klamathensis goyatoka]|uniref:fatty acyl-CoA hydrolase precursor, medium chain n=1 Tax=Rhinichthys klamathensis goyatoka TaxID=3034132 RepID=UPI0024B4C023|nr:fatty acyl-CoA hydrolase precursor, medium chain [Rhinichthys klamathensis goyatoka]